ncbi:MAG: hypothetical protein H6703_08270 [Myxococcales bacterium]|nr:hypothetical protein [Myxococcales bacterium]
MSLDLITSTPLQPAIAIASDVDMSHRSIWEAIEIPSPHQRRVAWLNAKNSCTTQVLRLWPCHSPWSEHDLIHRSRWRSGVFSDADRLPSYAASTCDARASSKVAQSRLHALQSRVTLRKRDVDLRTGALHDLTEREDRSLTSRMVSFDL